MRDDILNEMVELVVNWAKEQGMNYPSGFERKSGNYQYNYPVEIQDFINTVKSEIACMDDSSLRKFEYALLHIPEEKSFTNGQIIMINSIRSSVFIELDRRKNKSESQPGE